MQRFLAVVTILMGASVASAGKPTAEQATKTIEAWLEAVEPSSEDVPKLDAALALTGATLFSFVADDSGDGCKATSSTTPVARVVALACVRKYLRGTESLVAWPKKYPKLNAGPLRTHKKRIAALAKTATLLYQHDQCAGQGGDTIIAVVMEKKDDVETPKVAAVFVQDVFCGE